MSASVPAPLTKGKLAKLQAVINDEALVRAAIDSGAQSEFFDKDGPSVRRRRELVLSEYTFIINAIYEQQPEFHTDTFIEYTKTYLTMVLNTIAGRLADKPKSGALHQRKEALYWWAMRKIPKYSLLFIEWHGQITAHIGWLCLTQGLSPRTLLHEKNNMTDMEIDILFQHMSRQSASVNNWKQHYVAWILVWVTSIRPGSFTVCPGYAAGDDLGAGMTRPTDETFRWSDVTFHRMEAKIIVEIKFQFTKGQRNAYTNKLAVGFRTFRFLQHPGKRHHLHIDLLLTLLALERGLFLPLKTYEELLAVDTATIAKDSHVNQHPVFLASQVGKQQLEVSKPMKEYSLNFFLRSACDNLGFWQRNTIYSFRRTAIIETRRLKGSEFARELAGHAPNGNALLVYDTVGLADVDITALRLGEVEGTSREDIRRMFSQANTGRVDMTDALKQEMSEYVDIKMRSDPEYQKAEQGLVDALQQVWDEIGTVEGDKTVQATRDAIDETQESSQEMVALNMILNKALRARAATRQRLRKDYVGAFKKLTLEKQETSRKGMQDDAKRTGTKGALPAVLAKAREAGSVSASDSIEVTATVTSSVINSLELSTTENQFDEQDQWEEVDKTVLGDDANETLEKARAQPAQWEEVPEAAVVEVIAGGTIDVAEAGDEQSRIAFARTWLAHRGVVPTNITCVLCQLDETIPSKTKRIVYNRMVDFNRHLRGTIHSDQAQQLRAEANDK